MNEQMELLQAKMEENQKQMVQMQSWWDKIYNTAKSWFWDWSLILRLENWLMTDGSVLRKEQETHFNKFSSFSNSAEWNLIVVFWCFFFVFDLKLNNQYYILIVH